MNDYRNEIAIIDKDFPLYIFENQEYQKLFNIKKCTLGNILIAAKASDFNISVGKAYTDTFNEDTEKYGIYCPYKTSKYVIEDFQEALDFLEFKIHGQETTRVHNNCFLLSEEEIMEYFA